MERTQPHRRGPKSIVFKILTSKLFDIKILRTLFVNPAPSKVFRGSGGGGAPFEGMVKAVFPKLDRSSRKFISRRNPQLFYCNGAHALHYTPADTT